MENPVNAAKAAFNPAVIVKTLVAVMIALAIADALNLTDWILYPWTSAKGKFSGK